MVATRLSLVPGCFTGPELDHLRWSATGYKWSNGSGPSASGDLCGSSLFGISPSTYPRVSTFLWAAFVFSSKVDFDFSDISLSLGARAKRDASVGSSGSQGSTLLLWVVVLPSIVTVARLSISYARGVALLSFL